jgi:glucose-1-phosphate adenylyltransferase
MILAGGRVDELSALTAHRPKSAVPFGGMYRIVDFALSNLMHSGVERVGILSQYRSTALVDHIGVGESWDLFGRRRGVTLLPPSTGEQASDWYKGTADAVFQNLEYLHHHQPSQVLILSGDHVYKMDYALLMDYHLACGADLTIGFIQVPWAEASRFGVGEMDQEEGAPGGRVRVYQEKPAAPLSNWASLTIYLFNTNVLVEVLKNLHREKEAIEFGREVIPEMLEHYRVFGYRFIGYWGYTRTLEEYYQTNLDLLGDPPSLPLDQWEVRTNLDNSRIRDRQPAVLGPKARVSRSRLALGCRVYGEVSGSILFPGVVVEPGAVVRDSILFADVRIGREAVLSRTICDEAVHVGPRAKVGETIPSSGDRPPNITLIGQENILPDGLQVGAGAILYPYLKSSEMPYPEIPGGAMVKPQ